ATYTATDDVTLYAVWGFEKYTITFDANGGTFTTDDPTMTVQSGITMTLTTAQTLGLSHKDQEMFFTGWSRTQNGGVNFVDGANCTPEKDMTLYAVWSKNGDGSEGDPFLIDNWSRLKKLAAEVNGGNFYTNTHFRLTAELRNIDEDWTPIGQSYSRSFNGIFNGDGHRVTYKISNSTDTYQGLFGCLDTGGTIKNLYVYATISGGGMYCGGIAGWVSTSCAIKNCSSLVTLSSTVTEGFLGGIAGCNTGVTEYCTAQGNITNGGNENIHVGGIVGLNQSGTVSRCSGLVWVGSTRNYVGMVVGDNKEDTYAVGTVVDCNYLADMAGGHKGVGNGDGGTDAGTGSLSLDEMKAYALGLGDEFAVCREDILSGLSYGGDDGLGEAGERNSSSNGCNAGPGGVCGAMLALLVIRKEKRS
ncbi:MAG: InlB B-repeat-containing protein, partial [Fretibacterium sp.]|nr:InlB B-repeat-containing protein [Fretibacterium sp.]